MDMRHSQSRGTSVSSYYQCISAERNVARQSGVESFPAKSLRTSRECMSFFKPIHISFGLKSFQLPSLVGRSTFRPPYPESERFADFLTIPHHTTLPVNFAISIVRWALNMGTKLIKTPIIGTQSHWDRRINFIRLKDIISHDACMVLG